MLEFANVQICAFTLSISVSFKDNFNFMLLFSTFNFFSFSVLCSSSYSLSSWHPGSGDCAGLSVKKKCLHIIDNP